MRSALRLVLATSPLAGHVVVSGYNRTTPALVGQCRAALVDHTWSPHHVGLETPPL